MTSYAHNVYSLHRAFDRSAAKERERRIAQAHGSSSSGGLQPMSGAGAVGAGSQLQRGKEVKQSKKKKKDKKKDSQAMMEQIDNNKV